MKTAFAASFLSLCLSAQAFYILIDAGPAAWLDGHKVEQVSVELSNGDPAIPGELARSRRPFDGNLKAVDGKIVPMTSKEIAAREKAEADAAKAAQDAADDEAKAAEAEKAWRAAKLESAAAKGAKAKDADIAAAFAEIIEVLKEK